MNRLPDITVLMPVYNAGKYLREAIDSVLCQTLTNFEFLIVNDGSTDNSEDIIRSYTDPRIKLINQPNGGVSAALNTGLSQATGKYIARFDGDDICYPERLEKQYAFMLSNPDYILIGCDADYMSEDGDFLFTYRNTGHSNEEIQQKIDVYCPFVHSSVFYLKAPVIEAGGYEVKAHSFEDYFLWKLLLGKGKVCNFTEPLIKVRFNAASVTVDEKDRDPLFNRLKSKALKTGKISDEEGELLLKSIRRLSPLKKESSYHRMLGKKYLWNNYKPSFARDHLRKSMRLEPFKPESYLLFLMSFLPENTIKRIYQRTRA